MPARAPAGQQGSGREPRIQAQPSSVWASPVDQDESSPFLVLCPQPVHAPLKIALGAGYPYYQGSPAGGFAKVRSLFHLRQACSPVGSISILCDLSFVSVSSCKLRFDGPSMRRGDA